MNSREDFEWVCERSFAKKKTRVEESKKIDFSQDNLQLCSPQYSENFLWIFFLYSQKSLRYLLKIIQLKYFMELD